MKKFELIMSLLIIVVVVFFGVNIYNKVIYVPQDKDTVVITYTVTNGEDVYEDQSAYPEFAVDTDSYEMFTDEMLEGKKAGDEFSFDYVLPEDKAYDGETTVAAGTTVTIDATIDSISVYTEEESESSDSSESESSESTESESSEE